MNITALDRRLIWHPFTQEKTTDLPIAIEKSDGAYLYSEDNEKYLDLISSWWVNLFGHANKDIAKAIYTQAQDLEHVMFAGFTHKPAVTLAANLKKILPDNIAKFFYSDNGSTAVEVALKMAYQFWANKGINKKVFLSFDGGYHGDTFGAMSVGKKSGYHNAFSDLLFEVISIPYPETWFNDADYKKKEQLAINFLEKNLAKKGTDIAGLILEPIVQGASGMRIVRPQFLNRIAQIVKQHDLLIIHDEVMTGFGRTGTLFAGDQLNYDPDFICLSKGLTGGFLPLAITCTSQEIYDAFYSTDMNKTFTHGHSYTANPLACAAANASYQLLITNKTKLSLGMINKVHLAGIDLLMSNLANFIERPRVIGTISAIDLKVDNKKMQAIKRAFLIHKLNIRPIGNTVYLIPPYCISEPELFTSYEKILQIIQSCIYN